MGERRPGTEAMGPGAMITLAALLALSACGADDAGAPVTTPRASARRQAPEPSESPGSDRRQAAPSAEDEEPAPAAPAQEAPAAAPVPIEAGARLGPIRIGMSEDDVRALGLPESPVDPRSRRFGPYRLFFDGHGLRRVEALVGELGTIQIGDEVLPAGTHIHRIRDVIGDCEWYEGGGERYRCGGGTLFVQTTHTMDPARYTIAVQRR